MAVSSVSFVQAICELGSKLTRQILLRTHPSRGLDRTVPYGKQLAYIELAYAGKPTASRGELPPTIRSRHAGLGPRTDGMARSLLRFVCVYHQTRERPYQPSQRRTLGDCFGGGGLYSGGLSGGVCQ